jgi:uncharacterized delta-60 repeat protein
MAHRARGRSRTKSRGAAPAFLRLRADRTRIARSALVGVLIAGTVAAIGLDAGPAAAWSGDPDGSWATCGTRTVVVTSGIASEATSLALDANGLAVVAGSVGPHALVARLTADGKLDATFGTGGKTTYGPGTAAAFNGIARQPDGKLVAVGSRTDGTVDSFVVRVTAAGAVDTSFHSTGSLIQDFGGTDKLNAVQVQGNGAIVVGGTSDTDGFVGRLASNGTPDSTFSGDGQRTGLPFTVETLILQPDGKIIVGGRSASDDFAVMRLNSDGTTDSSFGGATGVTTDVGGYDTVTALALDADGRVLATGPGDGTKNHGRMIVRRYGADGVLDSTFNVIDRSYGLDDKAVAVFARADGAVTVVGNSKVGSDNDVLMLRFNSDGTRDMTFGIGGVALHDAGSYPVVNDAAIPASGRAVLVGSMRVSGRKQVAQLRYQGDADTAARPTQGFVIDGTGGLNGFAAGCASKPPTASGNTRFTSDSARGLAVLPGGRGLVLDRTGAISTFKFGDGVVTDLVVKGVAVWANKDMARGIAVVPEGTGGYVVDKYGVLHAFKIGSGPKPALPTDTPSWPGQDVARGIVLLPNGVGGYVLDEWGGLHEFGGAPKAKAGVPAWPGMDAARGVALASDGSGGWVLDLFGNLYPFGIGDNPAPSGTVGNPKWSTATARGVASLP